MSLLKKILKSQKKNSRVFYYLSYIFDSLKPRLLKKIERRAALSSYRSLTEEQKSEVDRRVALYNKLTDGAKFDFNNKKQSVYRLSDLKMHVVLDGVRSNSNYCIDSQKFMRCYDKNLLACFVFGDVWWTPEQPSFVKSRPIGDNNSNSVLLPLNHIRHFNFIKDSKPFLSKKDMLIGVSFAKQPHRQDFLRKYFSHPMCRLGSAHHFTDERKVWNIEYVSIPEHLDYKFILCLEGEDVATNLKWVMSSNSIAVMPRPKFETWFMESELIGGKYYIEIKDDYSDLEERLNYYISHPDEALSILEEAHRHVEKFKNKKIERITSMMVVDKYFSVTNQQ